MNFKLYKNIQFYTGLIKFHFTWKSCELTFVVSKQSTFFLVDNLFLIQFDTMIIKKNSTTNYILEELFLHQIIFKIIIKKLNNFLLFPMGFCYNALTCLQFTNQV